MEITQRLGFEATQAIATLNSLRTAISGVNRTLLTFNNRANAAGVSAAAQSFGQLSSAAQRADGSLRTNANSFRQAGVAGSTAGRQITASWETMLRVVQTQVLVRALSTVVQLFGESATAAGEFEIAVARIANITDGPGGSIDELTTSLRELAVELGRPIDEVTTAAFEAFQNDIGDVTQTMNILRTSANDLALVTGGELVDSVNTISSVLRIFNMDISQADRVADILFGTVDAGRVTLDDLASSLGSVAPLARDLGISFIDMSAAIAAITLQGVDSSRALTQLRGVTNSLLRPTTALQEAFTTLGVSSGPQLIEQFGGIVGALQALEGAAMGNEEVFASFFGRIRALTGATNILNNEASDTTRIAAELATNLGRVSQAADNVDATQARQLRIEIAALNDVLLGAGGGIVQFQTDLARGFNRVVLLARVLAGDIDLSEVALMGVRNEFNRTEQEARRLYQTVANGNQALARSGVSEQTAEIRRFAGEVSEVYRRLAMETGQIQLEIQRGLILASSNFSTEITNIVDEVARRIGGLQSTIDSLTDRASQALEQQGDASFENQLNSLNAQERVQARINRLVQAEFQLRDQASEVTGDPASVERLVEQERRVRDRANELLNEANRRRRDDTTRQVTAAERAQQEATIRQAERLRIDSLGTIVQANEAAARQIAALQDGIDTRRQAGLVADLNELNRLQQQLAEAEPASPEAQSLRDQINELNRGVDTELLDSLGLEDAFLNSLETFRTALNSATFEWSGAVASLQRAISDEIFTVAAEFDLPQGAIDAAQNATGDPGVAIENTINAGTAALERQALAQAGVAEQTFLSQNAYEQAGIQIETLREQARSSISTLAALTAAATGSEIDTSAADGLAASATNLENIRSEILRGDAAQQGAITERLASIEATTGTLRETGELSSEQATSVLTAVESLRRLQTSLSERNAQEGLINDEQTMQDIQNLEDITQAGGETQTSVDAIRTSANGVLAPLILVPGVLEEGSVAAQGINDQVGGIPARVAPAIQAANRLAEAFLRAARAAASIPSGGAANAFFGGGIQFRQDGGRIGRGQDTIPAVLSPGEFVVNSRAARNFSGELQAINAGQSPQFRQEGGSVTNIGDINVSVQTDSTRGVSGGDIASALRRELRRGTSTL